MILVHGTCVAISGRGILLRGPSGGGKSDLALRLIDGGALLVADDQTRLERDGDGLVASPPATIAGMIEVRGLGLVRLPYLERAPLELVIDLVSSSGVERLPEANTLELLGLPVRHLRLAPFEASAAAKVRLAMRASTRDIMPP
ncbi:Putative HPr kinase/phosphorylase, regulates carbohydrate metabolism [Magnetospirillum sp. XM-1]|uniref:HPr kinase/phosphorylase n=1 Tax=Magnetospirillum sp. XM-1 TaxID=1663591 RepID=UPI00073DC863|nr:HPr kinase/phosphatase C-terminal domain-containing protein [Magnetospirillum sp. XM-1]CUW37614.1 Putative HPr kinase/phosphorylase, regulates carbohydrate metabolism [Magnetospirillum sp. XM-1]